MALKHTALAAAVLYAGAAMAEEIDYNLPYDQIVAQADTFSGRHSLMPLIPPPAPADSGVKAADEPQPPNVVVKPVVSVGEDGKKTMEIPEEVPVAAAEGARANEAPATLEPVVLKSIHLDRVAQPTMLEDGGTLVPIKIDVIDEKAEGRMERPLLVGERKPQPIEAPKATAVGEAVPARGLAHIASYSSEESARRGIQEFSRKYPRTGIFEPQLRHELVPGKGYFWRVFFSGDRRELEYLCKDMKANNDWCLINK